MNFTYNILKGPELRDGPYRQDVNSGVDDILIDLIMQKDEKAFGAFYDRHGKLIYSLIFRILGHKPDAEEVTQEAFLKVWDNADKYDVRKGSVKSWLITLARRLAIDRTRSKQYKMRVRETEFSSADDSGSESHNITSKVKATDHQTEAREVNEALSGLDDQYRQLIQLSYFEGFSHSEISTLLDMPLGTVKHRIREAVIKLRKVFVYDSNE